MVPRTSLANRREYNDKDSSGQLNPEKAAFISLDKGLVNYYGLLKNGQSKDPFLCYPDSTKTRSMNVIQRARQDAHSFLYAGTILDQLRYPKGRWTSTKSLFSHLQRSLDRVSYSALWPICFEFFNPNSYRIASVPRRQPAAKLRPFSRKSKRLLELVSYCVLLFLGSARGHQNEGLVGRHCEWPILIFRRVTHKRFSETSLATIGFTMA